MIYFGIPVAVVRRVDLDPPPAKSVEPCHCAICARGKDEEVITRHAFAHSEFAIYLETRAAVEFRKPTKAQKARYIVGEHHVSGACERAECVTLPKHPRHV